jgi:hypothetical protein
MKSFNEHMSNLQTKWRHENLTVKGDGKQNGKSYPWILPKSNWHHGLWEGVRGPLDEYLSPERGVQVHTGVHNLKSSWALCANLYFPFREDKKLLAEFLSNRLSLPVKSVEEVELEFAAKAPLDPSTLLGEPHGQRGQNQTSPDIAFIVTTTSGGRGIILAENKFTEHSFYGCSGRKKKYGNPDLNRCMNFGSVYARPKEQCYQMHWQAEGRDDRRYWDWLHATFSDEGRRLLKRCPAATAGYQLFRQQALAEALASRGGYDLVVSAVAYDSRNNTLISSLRATGIDDFTEWERLFNGTANFKAFTHQDWFKWVADNNNGTWDGWMEYIDGRYRFSEDE